MRIFGLDVHRDTRSPFAAHLGFVLDRLAVAHVVDVGANVGQFARMLRAEAGFAGRIDSYEPVADSYTTLAAVMAGDPDWHGHRLAVGNQPGEVRLRLFPDSSLNSVSRPTPFGADLFASWEEFAEVGQESVPQVRLDDEALPDIGPLAIKVDTQGTDFDVLAGAADLLKRTCCVVVELSYLRVYEGQVSAEEAIGRLREVGFHLAGEFPITRARDELRVVEADGIFVHG